MTNSPLPTHDLETTKALWFEQHRKDLLAAGKLDELRQTYKDQREFLPDENTGKFWDQKFAEQKHNHPMENWRLAQVVKQVDPSKPLLNLGVGRGELEEILAKKYPKLKYTGTDITRNALKKHQKAYPSWKFQYAELDQLPFPKESFDQVLLLEVLEHIRPNETFEVLEELVRVLVSGGRAIISVPINEGLEEMLPTNPNSHMRIYSKELLTYELREAGLEVNQILYASAFTHWFGFKHFLNTLIPLRKANNLVAICTKKAAKS